MFSSMRLRAFLMAFTSAFLCFIVFWMAVLLLNPTAVSSSRQQEEVPLEQQGGSLYLPTKSDCMTLLLCEEGLRDAWPSRSSWPPSSGGTRVEVVVVGVGGGVVATSSIWMVGGGGGGRVASQTGPPAIGEVPSRELARPRSVVSSGVAAGRGASWVARKVARGV